MLWPKKNSYKEFENEKKFLQLENSLPPSHNFSSGPSLTYPGYQRFFLACFVELRFVGRRPTRVPQKAENTSGKSLQAPRVSLTQKDDNPHTAGLDDTAYRTLKSKLPRYRSKKIKKKKSSIQYRQPPCPPPSAVGNVSVLLTESKSWSLSNAQNWIHCASYDQRQPSPCKML